MTTNMIKVKFTQAGIHKWRDAPEHRKYQREPHRHLLTVVASIEQRPAGHSQIEVYDLLDFCQTELRNLAISSDSPELDFGGLSCNKLAALLLESLKIFWAGDEAAMRLYLQPSGAAAVEVWEDSECAAVAIYTRPSPSIPTQEYLRHYWNDMPQAEAVAPIVWPETNEPL